MHKVTPQKLTRLMVTSLLPLCLSACTTTFFTSLNAVTSDQGVEANRDIVFDANHQLALDVYRPIAAKDAPVVVFFYGGAWQGGKRQWYRWVGETLARHGVVAVLPDYRKFPQAKLDGFMHDAASAVAWAHSHAADHGGNADDLFLMGHSAGAHLGALLATDSSWLQQVGMQPSQLRGFIGLAGPYDFLPLKKQVYIDMFGHSHAQQLNSQPVNFVDGNEPPMLLLQGGSDQLVGPNNAVSLAAKIHQNDQPAVVNIYAGVSHTGLLFSISSLFRGKAPALKDALVFIDKYATSERVPIQ